MHKRNLWPLLLILAIPALMMCSPTGRSDFDDGMVLYRQNDLAEARPYFERALERDPQNPDLIAWLAEIDRRQGNREEAVAGAQRALALDSCHAFAHTVLGSTYNKMYGQWPGADREKTWEHLKQAVACDPADGNGWLDIWTEALYRGEYELADQAARAFIETGVLSPGILAYNRWVLQHAPENAILLTAGDMDTYPAVALQIVEGLRTDVAVVNYSLLNTPWYMRYLRDRYGLALPFADEDLDSLRPFRDDDDDVVLVATQVLRGWQTESAAGHLTNPIVFTATMAHLPPADDARENLCLMGAYSLWQPEPFEVKFDTAMIRVSINSVNPHDFSGALASPMDRSSVRAASTDRIVANITSVALQYAQALILSGRTGEALAMLDWVEDFEKITVLGPVFSDQIAGLREMAAGEVGPEG